MFSGKSTAALAVVRRNNAIGRKTLCITHAIDKRYSADPKLVSHDKESCPAVATDRLVPLLRSPAVSDAECIIVEEAQFFPDLMNFVVAATEIFGKEVICVGLDGDSSRAKFGQLLDLIPLCNSVQKFKALCTRCRDGTEALHTFRKPGQPQTQVNVGGAAEYEPLCRSHFLEAWADADRPAFVSYLRSYLGTLAGSPAELLDLLVGLRGVDEGSDLFLEINQRKH